MIGSLGNVGAVLKDAEPSSLDGCIASWGSATNHGSEQWMPCRELPSHKMLMSVLGGMSESERQHVQARVRAAMDAQVVSEGRHQGGRAPYGYRVVDGGPHPNPKKAAEGGRLRVLVVDEEPAEVVRRIFNEYIDGNGDRAIANMLNREGIPCPSALRPEQNRHRLADGWQGSTVRAILDNPRYTGYAVFGRWTRHEMLLDPDDVAAGNVTRFRRASPDRIVRSRMPAHPAIVLRGDVHRCATAAPHQECWGTGDGPQERAGQAAGAAYLCAARVGAVRGVPARGGGRDGAQARVLPVRGANAGARVRY